jgi:hypothetical protein
LASGIIPVPDKPVQIFKHPPEYSTDNKQPYEFIWRIYQGALMIRFEDQCINTDNPAKPDGKKSMGLTS